MNVRFLPEQPRDWRDDALCAQVDPELFYPDEGQSPRTPKRVCAGCPVRDECLQWALAQDVRGGIWGGASDRERRRMRRAA